jgi:Ca2+-binding RTX toxin-like protein
MSLLIGNDSNNTLDLGSVVGIAVGLGGDDKLTSPLNPAAPGSELYGNKGNDTITSQGIGDTARGGRDSDYVINTSGQAFLFGDIGNDTVYGDRSQITVFGGAGDDSVSVVGKQNLIYGDLPAERSIGPDDTVPGNDTIVAVEGGDTMIAGGGDDLLDAGLKSASLLFGNDGKDTIYVGAKGDTAFGGRGVDYLYAGSDIPNVGNLLFVGGEGNDKLIAENGGNNNIFAGDAEGTDLAGDDYLFVSGGNGHQLFGNLGNDQVIYGGNGSSTLYGGQGDDTVRAGSATAAYLRGDKGTDYLQAAGNNNTLEGGVGTWNDTVVLSSGASNVLYGDVVSGSDGGNDYLYAFAGGNNTLSGGAGNDYLFSSGVAGAAAPPVVGTGGAGTTPAGTGTPIVTGGGNVIQGGAGDDTVYYGKGDVVLEDKEGKNVYCGSAGAEAVKVTLDLDDVVLPGASGQFIFNTPNPVVAFIGTGGATTSDGSDLVQIDNAASETNTKGGNDTVGVGVLTNGTILTGDGNDLLNITGTSASGVINLGSGNDTLNLPVFTSGSVAGGAGNDIMDLGDVKGGQFSGDAGNDSIVADTLGGNTTLDGGADNDTIAVGQIGSGGAGVGIFGGAGNDILLGGTGNVGSTSDPVILKGDDGNDFLRGRQYGRDSLDGGAGNDILYGGSAADPLTAIQGAISAPAGSAGDATRISFIANAVANTAPNPFDGDSLTGGAGNDAFIVATRNETGFLFNALAAGSVGSGAATPVGTTGATTSPQGFIRGGTTAPFVPSGIYGVDTITDFEAAGDDDTLAIFTGGVTAASFSYDKLGTGIAFSTLSIGTLSGRLTLTTGGSASVNGSNGISVGTGFGSAVAAGNASIVGSFAPGHIIYDPTTGGVYAGGGNVAGAGSNTAYLVAVLSNKPTLDSSDVVFTLPNLGAGLTFF